MQTHVQRYAVAGKPRCIATVMGLTFSSGAALNLEAGTRAERWRVLRYHTYVPIPKRRLAYVNRVSPATHHSHQIIAAIISGMRNSRLTERSPMSFGSAFLAPPSRNFHTIFLHLHRSTGHCVRAHDYRWFSPFSRNIITSSYV